VLGVLLIGAGLLQGARAAVGFVQALRGPGYDAIAASTLFDGRWVTGGILAAAGLVIGRSWSLPAAVGLVVACYLMILPAKAFLRRRYGRP